MGFCASTAFCGVGEGDCAGGEGADAHGLGTLFRGVIFKGVGASDLVTEGESDIF